jgi:hypothetical protein
MARRSEFDEMQQDPVALRVSRKSRQAVARRVGPWAATHAAASVLQASGLCNDVALFRLNATLQSQSG